MPTVQHLKSAAGLLCGNKVSSRWLRLALKVRRMHQSLHHLVADAPWATKRCCGRCVNGFCQQCRSRGPLFAGSWMTRAFQKGSHSVGVARQYCGQVGKQDNCVCVSSVAMDGKSAGQLAFIPADLDGRREESRQAFRKVQFQPNPRWHWSRFVRQWRKVPAGVVADAGYGVDSSFRAGIKLGLGMQSGSLQPPSKPGTGLAAQIKARTSTPPASP
ncbi:MAG: transposase [Bryobacteraceae bacterium]